MLLFVVSHYLFVASQRAKSFELQPCWGFSAHQRAGWLCRIVKMWAQALTIVKNEAALSKGWRTQASLLRHYCSPAWWGLSYASAPHLLAVQFTTACCSSSGFQHLPGPPPPLHRHHSTNTFLYFYSWESAEGVFQH